MKGIGFFDKDFKPVNLPNADECKKHYSVWLDFMEKTTYIFFDIPERMKWFIETYRDIDDINSIFAKTGDGVYTYSLEDDYWFKETDRAILTRVYKEYALTQTYPLQDNQEE